MELTEKLLGELQKRLKIGNRRGVHLNAIPANSRYKFDLNRLSIIDKNLPDNFLKALLTELPFKFRITWKDNVPDLNSLFEEDQTQLVRITKAFENLINQTEAIESEKGINTFGFGFPILIRRDRADNKLTVAPILIWSLRIKRTREFNTWEINRNDEDPIYLNEILINHLQTDSSIEIDQIPSEMLDDGLITKDELLEICLDLIKAVNTTIPSDLEETFRKKLGNISSIGDKAHYEKLPLSATNSFIEFAGLFSIYEVQKQNIINDYSKLMELKGFSIDLSDLEGNSFQPISSVETDPSQQSILHSLETTRNVLIQGPPGTGKSQTLTAVLINALENNKKTIVVCEKKTALEVLHNALIEKGLNYHCVLIRDIVKDRKTVVNSVRDRVDKTEYRRYRYNYSKEALDNVIVKAKGLISGINKKHLKLDEKIIGSKCWSDVVGDFLAEIKENVEEANLNIPKNSFSYTRQELDTLLDMTYKGQQLYKDYAPVQSTSFINSLKLVGENPFLLEQNINEDFDDYAKQLEQIRALLEVNKAEFINLRKTDMKNQITSVNSCIDKTIAKELELHELVNLCKEEFCKFRNEELFQQVENLNQIISLIETTLNNNKSNPDLTNQVKVNSFSFKLLSVFSKKKKQTIANQLELQHNFSRLEQSIDNLKDFEAFSLGSDLKAKKNSLEKFRNVIIELKNNFSTRIDKEYAAFNLPLLLTGNESTKVFKSIQAEIEHPKNSQPLINKLNSIRYVFTNYLAEVDSAFQVLKNDLYNCKDIALNYAFTGTFHDNKAILSTIKQSIAEIESKFDDKILAEFQQVSFAKANPSDIEIKSLPLLQEKINSLTNKIAKDNWTINKIQFSELHSFMREVENLISHKGRYFTAEQDFFSIEFKWFQFYNGLTDLNKTIIISLKPKLNWKKSFLMFYLNSMLVNCANMDLPTNEDELIQLDKTLGGLESEQLKFIKEFWFSKQIDATREFEQKNVNLSVENLYNKKSGSRFKRLSLRQIVQYDANLFTTFFPVILTSPDVASNLFEGMNGYFDIVVFDEASQLRLEDNLPAILKGKQVVIAGDEHQMPPSNYFNKVFDGSVEDEEDLEEEKEMGIDKDDLLLSCESLLDFGSELNFHKKHLDFHYRSRHPFLIDFSNYAFYNQRLKPLPNNFDYSPIKYIQVNGTFFDHTNEAEAEMVLSILEKNINRLPNGEYPTVGIATFNIAQRNLIKSKILERQKFTKFEELNAKIQELEEKGMFVKNLENIQGDERDVIILSTTYGIGKDKKFAQRFGPLNYSKGYKLLNVIITRAKFKVYVCCSIPEQVFMNYKEYLVTEGSNNKRAVFYAYLAYCKAISESNNDLRLSVLTTLAENTTKSAGFDVFQGNDLESPFEEEVYQSLADRLGTEKLYAQHPFGGFRIDIVYDPKIIGVPKIAIECDGAKYHSSQEAYLYDRHRQKILENHGFVFHRIWSANWWRNPGRETTKLVEFIKQAEASKTPNYQDHSNTAFAFTDEVEILEQYVSQTSFIDVENDNATIQAIEKVEPVQAKNIC